MIVIKCCHGNSTGYGLLAYMYSRHDKVRGVFRDLCTCLNLFLGTLHGEIYGNIRVQSDCMRQRTVHASR
jgi:hypothetical protein